MELKGASICRGWVYSICCVFASVYSYMCAPLSLGQCSLGVPIFKGFFNYKFISLRRRKYLKKYFICLHSKCCLPPQNFSPHLPSSLLLGGCSLTHPFIHLPYLPVSPSHPSPHLQAPSLEHQVSTRLGTFSSTEVKQGSLSYIWQ